MTLAGVLLVLAVAGAAYVGQRVPPHIAPSSSPALPFAGAIDVPAAEAIVADSLVVSGWALDSEGVRNVSLRFSDGQRVEARYGLPRPDVAAVKPGYPNSQAAGFEAVHTFVAPPPIRHPFSVVATDNAGGEHMLGRRSLIPPQAFRLWADIAGEGGATPSPFYFLMATSGVASGGAAEVGDTYKHYQSATQRTGIAVPILYLRTTKGRSGDWVFDPNFDTTRKCGDAKLADDSLDSVLRNAVELRLPVQLILNGGIWADATCNSPEWDLNDHLEETVDNCQWTQDNHVFPDDHLKNLPGSRASPELARSLTFNVYAVAVRQYKKRNLQAAARRIAEFAERHPDLFVGVNLDADTYINPFFEEREWFDYNPATLRQFREWLRGDGPYAGRGGPAVPDLRAWRRKPLTLADVNRIAGRQWTSWPQVEPPRRLPGSKRHPLQPGETPIWDDPWFWEWDAFRKHLVALHYAELARWTREAGIASDRIFTAQGFVAPEAELRPFAIRIAGRGQNYDSGGVSIEGAIPRDAHLGAILYGPAAENRARMEGRHGLFATFARMDPRWAVVEMNTADLKHPQVLPTYAQAYRTFRDLFNYDAVQVSLMAWNGSNGIYAGQPGYVSYTSWRNTPAEDAMRDHMVSHANVPARSRLWTFGSSQHTDDDGWSVQGGTLEAGRGQITIRAPSAPARLELTSPADQVIRRGTAGTMVVGVDPSALRGIEVFAERAPGSGWTRLGATASGPMASIAAGVQIKLDWPSDWPQDAIVERLRVSLDSSAAALTIARIGVIRQPRK